MGKVTVMIESNVYNTPSLLERVRTWLDEISENSEHDIEYRNCKVLIVPTDEKRIKTKLHI